MGVLRLQRVYSGGHGGHGGQGVRGAIASPSEGGVGSADHASALADALLDEVVNQSPGCSLTLNADGRWVIDCEPGAVVGRLRLPLPLPPADAATTKVITVTVTATAVQRHANGHDVAALGVELASDACTTLELVAHVDELHARLVRRRQGDLAVAQAVFEHRGAGDGDGNAGAASMRAMRVSRGYTPIVSAAGAGGGGPAAFVRYPFHSSKRFANLCGPEVRLVQRRVEFFLASRAWYEDKGVPYRLGVLLSGETGSGKSSTIQAMAHLTKRHIVNVNLAKIATAAQLRRLFQSDDLYVHDAPDGVVGTVEPVRVHVPLHQRLYVIEEIDTVGDVVIDRRITTRARDSQGAAAQARCDDDDDDGAAKAKAQAQAGGLTLGDILQVLDGSVEAPGRLLVITSNFPERLDAALVRPGRLDLHVDFGLARRETLAELYHKLNDAPFPDALIADVPDAAVSLAEATEVMFRSFGEPERVVEGLVDLARGKTAHDKRIDALADAAVVEAQEQAERDRARRAKRDERRMAVCAPMPYS
jgi:hypothetical protein